MAETQALLDSLGFGVSSSPVYERGGYRYSNPQEAIAAAKLMEASCKFIDLIRVVPAED